MGFKSDVRNDFLNWACALRSNFYAAFLRFEFGGFYRLCFYYFGFSMILQGFNIGMSLLFSDLTISVYGSTRN